MKRHVKPTVQGAGVGAGTSVLAGVLMFALMAPAVLIPHKVSAQWLTFDVPVLGTSAVSTALEGSSAATGGTTAVSSALSAESDVEDALMDWVIKPLALALGRAAIQSLTKSTVNWINGGFEGSPAFATDLETNLRQLSDGIAQNFLTELASSAKINSPFIDSLVTNVGAAYYLYSSKDALAARLEDTLSKSSSNPAGFRAGNFNEGGWGAYFSTFSNDANNPIGARMIASQALAERLSNAAVQRMEELSYGSGFLSWKGDCIENNTTGGTGTATTGGTTSGHNTGSAGTAGAGSTNTGGGTATAGGGAAGAHSLSDAEGCLEREIVTPGSFFENKLNITTDSPLRQLELAQSIDAIVGALAQQLISKALGGDGGLRGASNPNPGGGSSATNQGSTAAATGLITQQDGLATTIKTSVSQVTAWKADSQTILTVAEAAKRACANVPAQLADPVEPAITTSSAAVTKGTELLTALNELLAKLESSPTSQDALTNTSYMEVASAYQALDLPSAVKLSEAARESVDTGLSLVPSLYTKLNTLATKNCVPLDPSRQTKP